MALINRKKEEETERIRADLNSKMLAYLAKNVMKKKGPAHFPKDKNQAPADNEMESLKSLHLSKSQTSA